MDKITKALRKLSPTEQSWVREILEKIQAKNFLGLNIQKLKGHEDIFRVRKGDIRIIYRVENKETIKILAIERRSEKTYRRI